jgi:hypothetical protein
MKSGMAGVEESIEVAGTPPSDNLYAHIECRADAPQGIERLERRVATLDPGDRPLGRAGFGGQVSLAPPSPLPDRADGVSESLVVHGPKSAERGISDGHQAPQNRTIVRYDACGQAFPTPWRTSAWIVDHSGPSVDERPPGVDDRPPSVDDRPPSVECLNHHI